MLPTPSSAFFIDLDLIVPQAPTIKTLASPKASLPPGMNSVSRVGLSNQLLSLRGRDIQILLGKDPTSITASESFIINIISPLFTPFSSTVNQCTDIMNHIPSAPTHLIYLDCTTEEINYLHAQARWSLQTLGELTSCCT